MGRLLMLVVMFCAIGEAGLGFFNRDKLTRINQELAASADRTKKLQAKLDELQKAMQQMGQQIESQERASEQQRDAINSDLASKKTKLAQLTDTTTPLPNDNHNLPDTLP